LGCNIENSCPTFIDFTKNKNKNVNILHKCKESKVLDHLLKTSIEENINEDNKYATLNHPLYDDELENTIEKDIHNISMQQRFQP
jgi:hypothetical protein